MLPQNSLPIFLSDVIYGRLQSEPVNKILAVACDVG